MNTQRTRWAAALVAALALAGLGTYIATTEPSTVDGRAVAAAEQPEGSPAAARSRAARQAPDAQQQGAPGKSAEHGGPASEPGVDAAEVISQDPDAAGSTNAVGGIKPTPSPPAVFDLSGNKQHPHLPGKAAAAGGGYTTGLKGCQLECIHTAKVQAAGTSAEFTLGTKVPTRMWVIITGVGVKDSGNAPTKNWQVQFTGLKANRSYDVTIAVEDADGHARHVYGKFKTLRRMALVRYQHVKVIFDGDNGANRGELRFHFHVDGEPAGGTPEDKIGSGRTVKLPAGYGALVANAPEQLDLAVTGIENDYTGRTFKKFKDDCYSPWTQMSEIAGTNGGSCWDTARAHATYDISTPATDDPAEPDGADIGFAVTTTTHKLKFTAYGAITVWYE
ncbi:MAG: hypothetical protein ACRDQB_18255 [Thermocrispum sp.]